MLVDKGRAKPKCIYCGGGEGTTRDHVPPKNLFSIPRPQLVTVPCCEACRQEQSLDDEYFVRMISMNRQVENPAAAFARDAVHRSLTKPNKIGFTRALINSIKEIPEYSPAGVYLGHATSYDVDLDRLCKVIERTMRGLYFHEFKARLADDTKCVTYALDGFATADLGNSARVRKIWQLALSGQKRMFGDNVFAYWFQSLDPTSATLWAFIVYGCTGFIAFTRPKPENAEESALPEKMGP